MDRIVPKRYPDGREIPPEVRRDIYAYYLLEKSLRKLKRAEKVKRKAEFRKVMRRKRLKRVV
ncbi:MAG: hypothetical protein PVI03_01430 [Candidatus Thorarchaeota archaeon]